jgi:hypothetical protein
MAGTFLFLITARTLFPGDSVPSAIFSMFAGFALAALLLFVFRQRIALFCKLSDEARNA